MSVTLQEWTSAYTLVRVEARPVDVVYIRSGPDPAQIKDFETGTTISAQQLDRTREFHQVIALDMWLFTQQNFLYAFSDRSEIMIYCKWLSREDQCNDFTFFYLPLSRRQKEFC